jgi:hypothetical protein
MTTILPAFHARHARLTCSTSRVDILAGRIVGAWFGEGERMSGLVDQTRRAGTGSGRAPEPAERVALHRRDARTRREAARARMLTRLLRERADLAGVHAPADCAAEAVRWGV